MLGERLHVELSRTASEGNDFKKSVEKKDLFPREYDAGLEQPDICHFDKCMVSRAV